MPTKRVMVGGVAIGGGAPVSVQSMTTEKTGCVEACAAQILRLQEAGCDIVRVAVSDEEDARALPLVKARVRVPIVADIHFSPRLAVMAVEGGADKLRINPGNIGGEKEIALVADCVKAHHIPVRVGATTGSIEPHFLKEYARSARALVESALYNVDILEKHGVEDIVISVKASDVPLTVEAYELLAQRTDYPLHVGITEAGTVKAGNIKSSVGLGIILYQGIGDTIRVSLTGDPAEEVKTAKQILRALGLRRGGIEVVSCPTCGRTRIDLISLAGQVETMVSEFDDLDIKVAVMGCVVNGPGEAREADIGIAGGIGEGLLIKKGEILRKVPEAELLEALRAELMAMAEEGRK